jgi:hypothetical protein
VANEHFSDGAFTAGYAAGEADLQHTVGESISLSVSGHLLLRKLTE